MISPERHPRLLEALRFQGLLSQGEAIACLHDYRNGEQYSSEAVNRCGGTTILISDAWRNRKAVRAFRVANGINEVRTLLEGGR